jgi:hypothetical protein
MRGRRQEITRAFVWRLTRAPSKRPAPPFSERLVLGTTDPSKGVALAAIGRFAGCDAKSHRPTPRFRTMPGHEQLGRDVAFEKTRWQRPPGPCPLSGKPDIEPTAPNDRLPCQLPLLAGPEHGRTIPLADIAKRLSPCAEFMSTGSVRRACDQYLVRSAPAEHQQRPALDPNRP